jgi:hypothetical protein
MGHVTFLRYTNIASTLDILENTRLTLLNPSSWDDRNDAYSMSAYKDKIGAETVLALCFAEGEETYHHWKVFSHGCDGISIEFKKEALIGCVSDHPGVRADYVEYKEISDLVISGCDSDKLPFLKRFPYRNEMEFRVIHVDKEKKKDFECIPFSLNCIECVKLSPWMPSALSSAVKTTMRRIPGCERLNIYSSTLLENENWKSAINDA